MNTAFPPVPVWRPSFNQPIDRVVDRFRYYADGARDFVVFEYGTCALVTRGLGDDEAARSAIQILSSILGYHPDMTPNHMDDGNILVSYREPACNVVLADVAQAHWAEVEARHQDGLTPGEVLFTPLGQNIFDDFGKKALLGRCYMFMDAQGPRVLRVERATA
ncbi:MAG: hypothetical protein ACREH4_06865 [Vitreimonas sp.]